MKLTANEQKSAKCLCFLGHITSISLSLAGFYTKGCPLVKSNLICPSDKLSWQPGCPFLNINIQGNFCISQGSGSSDNLPENLVYTPALWHLKSKWVSVFYHLHQIDFSYLNFLIEFSYIVLLNDFVLFCLCNLLSVIVICHAMTTDLYHMILNAFHIYRVYVLVIKILQKFYVL